MLSPAVVARLQCLSDLATNVNLNDTDLLLQLSEIVGINTCHNKLISYHRFCPRPHKRHHTHCLLADDVMCKGTNSGFLIIRPPGTVVGYGRSSVLPVMFSFFSTRNLRAPSANHRETSPHDRCLCLFYKLTTKIRGALPQKNWGQKHAKFRSILDHFKLRSRMSPERLKISKIGKLIHQRQFFLRYMKKSPVNLVH